MNRLYFDCETIPAFEPDDPFIEKWVKKGGKKFEEKLIDPDFSQIIAIGYGGADYNAIVLCNEEPIKYGVPEKVALADFWETIDGYQLVSFNGKGFDLPVIIRRSQLLGLSDMIPANIDDYLNIYKNEYHLDMMHYLGFNKRWRSQEFYAERFRCETQKHGDGADIVGWYGDNCWDDIRLHCEADVKQLEELTKKAGV